MYGVIKMFRIGATDYMYTNKEHSHKFYEVLIYTEGKGKIYTSKGEYFFSPGTIVILPPDTKHCTKSEERYTNIFVNGNLEQFFSIDEPAVFTDNERGEGMQLAKMLYNNRFVRGEFLTYLCSAYMQFIMKNLKTEDGITLAVNKIIHHIMENYHDNSLSLKDLLTESGYAQDYIRSQFKRLTEKTPNEFLTQTRIKHAIFLIETYGNSLSLTEIAEQCGYTDYVYFSKKFKQLTGESPRMYKSFK